MARHMLTTLDNPYNPYNDWDEWLAYDNRVHNGSTTSLLGRVVDYSDELSESDKDLAIEQAIDTIVKEDPGLIYRKISSKNEMISI